MIWLPIMMPHFAGVRLGRADDLVVVPLEDPVVLVVCGSANLELRHPRSSL
jgi:hypothetical protein